MSERVVCPRCRRPPVVCYCAHVRAVDTRTRVLFLQHPRERDVPIGTVRIARLCLPNSELRLGVDFSNDPVVRREISDPSRPAALLFPGPGAVDLRTSPPEGPITLVVVDGTWSQAAKLLKLNPALRALPQYRLAPSRPSDYRIRKEPAEHCVATIEAVAEVLGVLEGDPAAAARLLEPFRAMVETQLDYAKRVGDGRARHAKRNAREKKPRPVPAALRERPGDVVVAYGEANAWPFDWESAPAPEIVHWVARRLGTGESFECVVAPRAGVAPGAPYHTGLDEARIAGGESFEAFLARWRAFVRPADVLCTWGSYAADVLSAQGVEAGERLDLRAAASQYLGARAGGVEECVAKVGAAAREPWLEGRAGRRLAAIVAIAEALAGK